MAQQDALPINHRFLSPTVTVIVGSEGDEKKFTVHEHLLTQASGYFRGAFRNDFIEARSREFRLDEDSVGAFDLFVEYLYGIDENWRRDMHWWDFHSYGAHAFVMGCKLLCPDFKTWIVKQVATDMVDEVELSMSVMLELATIVYSGTSAKNGKRMRTVLATYGAARLIGSTSSGVNHAERWSEEDRMLLAGCHQQEFISDVMK